MTIWQDLHYSLRSLRQNPALTATCCSVLAIGLGANTTIFSAVKAILLDPLPYRDSDRLAELYEAGVVKGDVRDEPAPGNFYDWQRRSTGFSDIAAYGGTDGNLGGGAHQLPEHVKGSFCSWNLFRTLGVPAQIGRVFIQGNDSPKAARTIILSESLWKHRFGGDRAVIGQIVRLDAQIYAVVGVMPRSF